MRSRSTVVRAEGDHVVAASTSGNAGGIIISIRISFWTCSFEDLGISRGLARLRAPEAASAAIPGRVEGRASAFASHHSPVVMRPHLKSHRAHHVQVTDAPGVAALAGAFERLDGDGQVVPVDEAHVVEVLVVAKGDLGKSGGWGPAEAATEEVAAAVTGGAAAAA